MTQRAKGEPLLRCKAFRCSQVAGVHVCVTCVGWLALWSRTEFCLVVCAGSATLQYKC